ncbi:MAG: hypothetical protein VKJ06_00035 [Vampirovibrionales bacterium]|nr:hypothetical protein [Vampirovibrionales bacterium]
MNTGAMPANAYAGFAPAPAPALAPVYNFAPPESAAMNTYPMNAMQTQGADSFSAGLNPTAQDPNLAWMQQMQQLQQMQALQGAGQTFTPGADPAAASQILGLDPANQQAASQPASTAPTPGKSGAFTLNPDGSVTQSGQKGQAGGGFGVIKFLSIASTAVAGFMMIKQMLNGRDTATNPEEAVENALKDIEPQSTETPPAETTNSQNPPDSAKGCDGINCDGHDHTHSH